MYRISLYVAVFFCIYIATFFATGRALPWQEVSSYVAGFPVSETGEGDYLYKIPDQFEDSIQTLLQTNAFASVTGHVVGGVRSRSLDRGVEFPVASFAEVDEYRVLASKPRETVARVHGINLNTVKGSTDEAKEGDHFDILSGIEESQERSNFHDDKTSALAYVLKNSNPVSLENVAGLSQSKTALSVYVVNLPKEPEMEREYCRIVLSIRSPIQRVTPLLSLLVEELFDWAFWFVKSEANATLVFDENTRSPRFSVAAQKCSTAQDTVLGIVQRVRWFAAQAGKAKGAGTPSTVMRRAFLQRISLRALMLKHKLLDTRHVLQQTFRYASSSGFILDEDLLEAAQQVAEGGVERPFRVACDLLLETLTQGRISVVTIGHISDVDGVSKNQILQFAKRLSSLFEFTVFDVVAASGGRRKVEWDRLAQKLYVYRVRPVAVTKTSATFEEPSGALVAYQVVEESSSDNDVQACKVRLSLELMADVARSLLSQFTGAVSDKEKPVLPLELLGALEPDDKSLVNQLRQRVEICNLSYVDVQVKDIHSKSPYLVWTLQTKNVTTFNAETLIDLESFVTYHLGHMISTWSDSVFHGILAQFKGYSNLLLGGDLSSRIKLETFYLEQILSTLHRYNRPRDCAKAFTDLVKWDVHDVWQTYLENPVFNTSGISTTDSLLRKGTFVVSDRSPTDASCALEDPQLASKMDLNRTAVDVAAAHVVPHPSCMTSLEDIADFVQSHVLLPAEGYLEDFDFRGVPLQ